MLLQRRAGEGEKMPSSAFFVCIHLNGDKKWYNIIGTKKKGIWIKLSRWRMREYGKLF